jgi:hypothetical protein
MANLNSLFLGGSLEGLFKEIDPDIPFPPFPKLKILELDCLFSPYLSLQNFEQLMRPPVAVARWSLSLYYPFIWHVRI